MTMTDSLCIRAVKGAVQHYFTRAWLIVKKKKLFSKFFIILNYWENIFKLKTKKYIQ